MLREMEGVRQDDPDRVRRWFRDEYFELIVWQTRAGDIVAFQLCYDVGKDERALTWRRGSGIGHASVEEGGSWHKAAPSLDEAEAPEIDGLLRRFESTSGGVDESIRRLVLETLRESGF